MPMKAIGAFVLVLLVVLIVGQLWFHFVEGVLHKIQTFCKRQQKPPAWHPLPPELQEKQVPAASCQQQKKDTN